MRNNIHLLKSLIGAAALLFASGQAMAGVVVVVSSNSDISSMSGKDVKAAYLGKGKKFNTIALPEDSATHNGFMSKVVGKSDSQFKAYWSKKIFSGKGVPPKVVDNAAAVKRAVAGSTKAIGYIDSSELDNSVKVVYRVE